MRHRRSDEGCGRRVAIAVAAAPFLALACTGPTGAPVTATVRDSAGVEVVTLSGAPEDLPALELGEATLLVSGDAPPQIGSVGEVALLGDGRLVIEDDQADRIHLFDTDGALDRTLGGRGDGPGEFQNVTAMSTGPGDSIYVYDARHGRVSVLHPQAGLVREVTLATTTDGRRPFAAWLLDGDRLAVMTKVVRTSPDGSSPEGSIRIDALLTVHAADGRQLSEPVVFPGEYAEPPTGVDAWPAYTPRPVATARGGTVAHASAHGWRVWIRDADLGLRREIRWPGAEGPISEQEVDSVRIAIRDDLTERAPLARATAFADALLSTMPEVRPPIGGVLLGDGGRLWVSSFEPTAPGWRVPRVWYVFELDGTPVGRLTLRDGARLLGAAPGAVLLVERDELDVQHVVRRALIG